MKYKVSQLDVVPEGDLCKMGKGDQLLIWANFPLVEEVYDSSVFGERAVGESRVLMPRWEERVM